MTSAPTCCEKTRKTIRSVRWAQYTLRGLNLFHVPSVGGSAFVFVNNLGPVIDMIMAPMGAVTTMLRMQIISITSAFFNISSVESGLCRIFLSTTGPKAAWTVAFAMHANATNTCVKRKRISFKWKFVEDQTEWQLNKLSLSCWVHRRKQSPQLSIIAIQRQPPRCLYRRLQRPDPIHWSWPLRRWLRTKSVRKTSRKSRTPFQRDCLPLPIPVGTKSNCWWRRQRQRPAVRHLQSPSFHCRKLPIVRHRIASAFESEWRMRRPFLAHISIADPKKCRNQDHRLCIRAPGWFDSTHCPCRTKCSKVFRKQRLKRHHRCQRWQRWALECPWPHHSPLYAADTNKVQRQRVKRPRKSIPRPMTSTTASSRNNATVRPSQRTPRSMAPGRASILFHRLSWRHRDPFRDRLASISWPTQIYANARWLQSIRLRGRPSRDSVNDANAIEISLSLRFYRRAQFTWNSIPVISIPISRGNVVNDIRKPPKLAATVNTTKPNNRPPGAAVSPTITYTVIQATIPATTQAKLAFNLCSMELFPEMLTNQNDAKHSSALPETRAQRVRTAFLPIWWFPRWTLILAATPNAKCKNPRLLQCTIVGNGFRLHRWLVQILPRFHVQICKQRSRHCNWIHMICVHWRREEPARSYHYLNEFDDC